MLDFKRLKGNLVFESYYESRLWNSCVLTKAYKKVFEWINTTTCDGIRVSQWSGGSEDIKVELNLNI